MVEEGKNEEDLRCGVDVRRGRLVLRLRGMLVRKSGRLGVLVLVKFED